MSRFETHNIHRGTVNTRRFRWPVGAIVLSALALAPMVSASGASLPTLKSANVAGSSGALVNHSSRTLYLLTSEKGAKIKCASGCLTAWPPLLVKSTVKTISLGANVKGKIGFVTRSKTMKQVTFNSYPVYTYSGDSAALQSTGEGIVAFGGTWYLIKANSTSAGSSAFLKSSASTVTTTTSSGGAYNY